MTTRTDAKAETRTLHGLLQPAIYKAWQGSNNPVKIEELHEANHVARFVYAAPPGIAAAINTFNGVVSTRVQGVFLHKKPYAFWIDHLDKDDISKREIADLMIAVRIRSRFGTASRALLVQVKMGDEPTWSPGVTLSVDAGQRRLYTDLPPFCMEFGWPKEVTKKQLLKTGITSLAGLRSYDLSSLHSQTCAGLVYAAVDRQHQTRSNHSVPWLVEDGKPPQPVSNSVTFEEDFAWALADMIVESQPLFGLRVSPGSGHSDWSRLIRDLRFYAHDRAFKQKWKGGEALDITLGDNETPTHDILNNIAACLTHHGQLLSMYTEWRCGPFNASSSIWSRLDEARNQLWPRARVSAGSITEGPPRWPAVVEREPEEGFGVVTIDVDVESRGM